MTNTGLASKDGNLQEGDIILKVGSKSFVKVQIVKLGLKLLIILIVSVFSLF